MPKAEPLKGMFYLRVEDIDNQSSNMSFDRKPQRSLYQTVNDSSGIFSAETNIGYGGLMLGTAMHGFSKEQNDVTQQASVFIVTQHVKLLTGLIDKLPFKKF